MADRARQIASPAGIGVAAALAVAALVLLPVAVVWSAAATGGSVRSQDWSAIRFTLLQAALSAGISVALAVPVARALWHRRFPGRRLLILAMGAPFILPAIVAVFGLLAVFGRGGLVNRVLGLTGAEPVSVYGLFGVVLAHVFFNLPFVTRLLLLGWAGMPSERFRLAASLGMGRREVVRFLERPMLREVLPGAFLAVFLVSVTSFTVALTMGGGPRATTVELAIYQAFRFDFDLGRASMLAAVQVALCMAVAAAGLWFTLPAGLGAGAGRPAQSEDGGPAWYRLTDAAWIVAAALFLLVPMAAVVTDGAPHLASLGTPVWAAALRSLAVAAAATVASVAAALFIALALATYPGRRGRLIETLGLLPMASSALVFGTGMFLILRGIVSPQSGALPLTMAANALASLPFALRVMAPDARRIEADYGRLADSLAMTGWVRVRLVFLPRLRRATGFAAGLAAALSMGDLGVIVLFGDPGTATLPLVMYQLMGSYRTDAAAGAALLLSGMSLTLFWLCDRWGHRDTGA